MFARHLGNKVAFKGEQMFTREIIIKSAPRKSQIKTFKVSRKEYTILEIDSKEGLIKIKSEDGEIREEVRLIRSESASWQVKVIEDAS